MRILITGVTGYAGFYAAMRLAGAGHKVTGLARNPAAPRLDILRAREITIAQGDIHQPGTYRELLEQSQVIVHTLFDKKSPKDSDRTFFATLAGLNEHAGTRRRLIYTTGCSIMGDVGGRVLDETIEPNPAYPLGFRRELEREALALPNIGVVVLRPCFMYGNGGYNSQIADWFEMAKSGEVVYRGDRERRWSWLHVDDLTEAYMLAVEGDRSIDGEVFCITDGSQERCVDVMRAALAAAGYTGEIRFEAPLKGDSASMWFDRNEVSSPKKARRVLGWSPQRASVLEAIPAAYAAWEAAQKLSG
jgi:nucleoside-diphosphate-sugar epimerase